MTNIVIDTNILRKNPKRDNAEFEALKILSKGNKLKIYLPYIIKKEFLSQYIEQNIKPLDNIISELKTLEKKSFNQQFTDSFLEKESEFIEVKKNLIEDIEKEFLEWCKELNIVDIELNFEQLSQSIEKYFLGKPPYQSIKSRKDIPDSIIFESLKEIKTTNCDLIFISEDKNLSKHCSELDINVYSSLEDFIKSKKTQLELTNGENFIDNIYEELSEYLDDNYPIIDGFIFSYKFEDKIGCSIESYLIQSDDNRADVTYVDYPYNIHTDFDDISYYGNNKIGFTVSFDVDIDTDVFIFKSDYYSLENEYSFYDDWNEHYFLTNAKFRINVRVKVLLSINKTIIELDDKEIDFKSFLDFNTLEIDEIYDIEVEENITNKTVKYPKYELLVNLDRDIEEKIGETNKFQINTIFDVNGNDFSENVEIGNTYENLNELRSELSYKLKVPIENIILNEN